MKHVFSLSVVGAAIFPVVVTADPSFECSIKSSSQVETAKCVAEAEETVDRALETALKFATDSARELDEVTGRDVAAPALEQAQKAWVQYRQDHCNFVGTTFGGGSGAGIATRSCRVELGRVRVKQLFEYLR